MVDVQHKALGAADGHQVLGFAPFANAAARAAQSVTSADVRKFGWQTDTGELWILTNHSPATWKKVTLTDDPGVVEGSLYGAQGLTASARYESAAGGVDVDTTILAVLFTPLALTVSAAYRTLFSYGFGSGRGLEMLLDNTDQIAGYFKPTGSPAPTAMSQLVSGDLNKIELVIMQHKGTALSLYRKRAQVGSDTSITDYVKANGTDVAYLGARNTVQFCTGIAVHGYATFTVPSTQPTLAHFQALYDATKSAGALVGSLSNAVCKNLVNFPSAAPASIPDTVGSGTMSKVGAPTGYTAAPPKTWSW